MTSGVSESEQPTNLNLKRIEWSELLPWTHLFQAFRIALEPNNLLMGAFGSLTLWIAWALLINLFSAIGLVNLQRPEVPTDQDVVAIAREEYAKKQSVAPKPTAETTTEATTTPTPEADANSSETPNAKTAADTPAPAEDTKEIAVPAEALLDTKERLLNKYRRDKQVWTYYQDVRHGPWNQQYSNHDVYRSPFAKSNLELGSNSGILPNSFFMVVEPLYRLAIPAWLLVEYPDKSFIPAVLLLVFTLIVWGFFGGVITRIAAVKFADGRDISLMEAVRYVQQRFLNYFVAPGLPWLLILILFVCFIIGGLLAYVPVLNILMAGLWPFTFIGGLLIFVALVGLLLGWPFMYAAISVESTEALDACTRPYSYILFGHPWRYLGYALVAFLFGGLLMTFATIVAHQTMVYSVAGVGLAQPEVITHRFYAFVPSGPGWQQEFGPALPDGANTPKGTWYLSATIVGFWAFVLFLFLEGFLFSYFWSASTIIYFLLRRDVERTELDEIFLEEDEEDPFPTPIVTTPITDRAEGPKVETVGPVDAPLSPGLAQAAATMGVAVPPDTTPATNTATASEPTTLVAAEAPEATPATEPEPDLNEMANWGLEEEKIETPDTAAPPAETMAEAGDDWENAIDKEDDAENKPNTTP